MVTLSGRQPWGKRGSGDYIYLSLAWACNTYAEIEKSCSFLVMSLSRCRTCVASASFNHCCVLLSASCATWPLDRRLAARCDMIVVCLLQEVPFGGLRDLTQQEIEGSYRTLQTVDTHVLYSSFIVHQSSMRSNRIVMRNKWCVLPIDYRMFQNDLKMTSVWR